MKRVLQVLGVAAIATTIVLSLFFTTGVLAQAPTSTLVPTPRQIIVEDPDGGQNVTVTIQPGQEGTSQEDIDRVWTELGSAIISSPKMKDKVLEGGQRYNNRLTVNVHRDNKDILTGKNEGNSEKIHIDLGDITAMLPHLTGNNAADKEKIITDHLIEILAHEITHSTQIFYWDGTLEDRANEEEAVMVANQVLAELGLSYMRESYGYCDYCVMKTFINYIMRDGFLVYKFDLTEFMKARGRDGKLFDELCPVGGIQIPVNKLALLAPYIALASIIVVATAIYFKRVRHRKEVQ